MEALEQRLVLSTYYVSPTGSDSNNGSAASPFATLQEAANMVVAGDTVDVASGTYAGFSMNWEVDQTGTASAPITWNASPGAVINAPNPDTADGIDIEGASYVVINGFTVNNTTNSITRAGIRSVGNTNVVIENNVAENCGQWAIFSGFSDNLDIINNVASGSQIQHGIYVSNTCTNPEIIGNTVFGNHESGIQLNGDASEGGAGIITNALVENNVIYNNGAAGGSAINCDGVQNAVIANNLLYGNQAGGIALFQIDGGGPSINNTVADNTIVSPSNGRWDVNIQAASGNSVYNNILYNSNPAAGSIAVGGSLSGFTSDYNVVVNSFTSDGGNSYQTFSQWQSSTGQDLHSFVATPAQLFVNSAANNYQELASSPSVGAGISTDAPATDLLGNARPSANGYDIGAYEFQPAASAPPLVSAESPASSAVNVVVSSAVTATFNQPIQAGTVSFILKNSAGNAVAASVTYNSSTNTATLTPTSGLSYATTYTATVSGAKNSSGVAMSAPVVWSFATDPLQPAVSSHSPASGAATVAVTSAVTATFNEAVQSSTITFGLKNSAGTAIAGTTSYNTTTNTATFTPSAALANGTTYSATVSGAKDTAGDSMSGSTGWSFTTSSLPTVSSHTPTSGATNVAVTSTLSATFNEAVQSNTVAFTLKNSAGTAIAGTLSYNSTTNTETFTPKSALVYATTYTATVSGAKDTAGDLMSGSTSWSFTTDALQPSVSSHTPASGATGVAVTSIESATFNEAVQLSSISFALKNSAGTSIAGALSYNSTTNTATFTPSAALAFGTTYTATVSGAKDTAGDPMAAAVSWSFTTAYLTVSAGSNITTNPGATVTFAGAVSGGTAPFSYSWNFGDGSTLSAGNSANFTQTDTTTQGSWSGKYGSAGYNVIGKVASYPAYATVTPSGQKSFTWAASTSDVRALQVPGSTSRFAGGWYSASSFTIDVNLTDGQVHPLSIYALDWDTTVRSEKIQVLDGTTGAVLNSQTISGFHNGEYLTWNVSGHVKIQVTHLGGANAVISGLFIGAGSASAMNTLAPSHVYASPGTYTATLTATDSAGHSGSASTLVTVKSPVPVVTAESPATGATGVAVSSPITATFSEAVQASTIGFTLKNSSGNSVSATATYNPANFTVTLTPSAPLAYGTTYTATVSGAKDTFGDSMGGSVSWPFTTDPMQPAVNSFTPSAKGLTTAGVTGVPVSTAPSATFNEAVQTGTITFTLTTNTGTSVPGTISYNPTTNTAIFTPSVALAYGMTYVATVSGAKDAFGDPISGSTTWTFTTDALQPAISSHTPATGATGVAVAATATATFNEAIQAGTIVFTLANSAGTSVPGALSYNSTTNAATFTPTAALAYGTKYTASVSGARDAAGDPMNGSLSWSFTTDALQPAVTSHTPASSATGVAVSAAPSETFNQAVQASTITFTLTNSAGTAVAGTTSYNAATNTETFTPTAALAYGIKYTATVSGAKDAAGDPMNGLVSWSFTTDAAQPTVISHTPAPGGATGVSASSIATGVAVVASPTATFNEAVQASTISFTLTNSAGASVAGSLSYNTSTNIATLTPSVSLAYGTTYTASLSGAKDLAGDPMSGSTTWSFTTDALQPAVSSHSPASSATGVAVSTAPSATFNEAVQSSTITFSLASSAGTSMPGTLSYNSTTNTETFTPSAPLVGGTTYTATVSGAKDTAGDPMSGSTSWTFTTIAAGPTVTAETPAANASAVPTNTTLTATFSGAMSASTITVGNFVLKSSAGTTVTATVAYNTSTFTASLTPSARLANSTTYTATINGVTDSAGHPLGSAFSWSFTTGPAPAVSSQTPAAGATNVIVSAVPSATFNEAVQSSTISFTLKSSTGTAVAGTVSYNSATNTATFKPSAALAYNTKYTATVSGAKDTAGDPMSGSSSWTFTTDPLQPAVTKVTPTSGTANLPLTTAPTVTFNEAVQAGSIVFTLTPSGGTAVSGTVSYSSATNTTMFTPSAQLANDTTFTASVSGVKDTAGDSMSGAYTWSFITDAPATTPGLVAEWQFNEGSGASTADGTGNGNVGTFESGVSWTPGLVGPYALSFNSQNDGHVAVFDAPDLEFSATQSYTLSTWVYVPYLNGQTEGIVTKATGAGGTPNGYGIWIYDGRWVEWSNWYEMVGPGVNTGWSEVSLVQDGTAGTMSLYVDGVLAGTGSAQACNGAANMWFGGDAQANDYFDGALDDVRVYNTALSATQLQSLYNAAPPTVIAESPAGGGTNVGLSSGVTATFNEAVQASTITFTLTSSSGVSVPATVSYNSSSDTATLTPTSPLAYSTSYTATVSGAQNGSGGAMPAPVSWSFTTPSPATVISTTPLSDPATLLSMNSPGATTLFNIDTSVSTLLTATFNQPVEPQSISFSLVSSSGSSVPATVSYNSSANTVTLTPNAALAYGTTYTATVSGAQTSYGLSMTAPYSWSFTTDTAPPSVVVASPSSGSTGVPVTSTVTAWFNGSIVMYSTMAASNLNFTLTSSSGASVPASFAYNLSTNAVTLTPNAALAYGQTYKATLSGAVNASGDPMTAPYTWSFTTVPSATALPAETTNTPAAGANGVSVSSAVTASFNEAVTSSMISFSLKNTAGATVPATVTYNSSTDTATLTPTAAMAVATTYTAIINGAVNSSGTGPVTWSFTTVGPTVITAGPLATSTGVPASASITATFNEAIQSGSITASTFSLKNASGATVAATVTYNASTNTATLVPSAPLAYSASYTVSISGATDASGRTMANAFTWSFTTAPAALASLLSSLSIPFAPGGRIWWTPATLAAARAWWATNSYVPNSNDVQDLAFAYLMSGNLTYGQMAVNLLTSFTVPTTDLNTAADNPYRWGYEMPIAFDWVYNLLTPVQVSTFISTYNNYVQIQASKSWGGPGMEGSNYYWGYWENEVAWSVASYYINPMAPKFLYDALVTRWQNDVLPWMANVDIGGVTPEGSEYGEEMLRDIIVAQTTLKSMGLDLLSQTNWYQASALALIYDTSPAPNATDGEYIGFPRGDDEDSGGLPNYTGPSYLGAGTNMDANAYGDFMTIVEEEWPNQPIGELAQQWINTVRPTLSPWVASTAKPGPTLPLSSLPTDYYGTGVGFLYTRSSWSSTATNILLQLSEVASGGGHEQADQGSFQIESGNEQLAVEHTGYANTFLDGSYSEDTIAHNGILYNEVGQVQQISQFAYPQVLAVESTATFSYAAVDITSTYQSAYPADYPNNPYSGHTVREYIFIKPLNTLFVIDRLQSSSASVVQSFLLHTPGAPTIVDSNDVTFTNGGQELFLQTLSTAGSHSYSVTDEGSMHGGPDVRRLQDNFTGSADNVLVHAITTGPAGSDPVSIAITGQTATTWTITVTSANGTAVLVLNQGTFSLGGSFGYAASGTPAPSLLPNSVQSITVTSNGPVWGAVGSSSNAMAAVAFGVVPNDSSDSTGSAGLSSGGLVTHSSQTTSAATETQPAASQATSAALSQSVATSMAMVNDQAVDAMHSDSALEAIGTDLILSKHKKSSKLS
jgi:methionine-rich copper-binding protein CopC